MSYEQKKDTNNNVALGFIFVSLFLLLTLLLCNFGATIYLIQKSQVSASVSHQSERNWYGERSTEFVSSALWIPADELPPAYQVTDMERVTINVPADQVHIEKGEGKTFLRFFEGEGGRYYWPTDLNIEMITEAAHSNKPTILQFEITKYTYFKGGWFLVVEMVTVKE